MKTEELNKLGLTDEQIKEIFSMNGKDIEEIKKDLESAKKDLESANSDKENALKQVTEYAEKLKNFDDVNVEEMKGEIAKLTKDIETQKANYESEKLERAFQDKLDAIITKNQGKNATAIKSLLDVATLRDSKNQDADIESALENVKKENDFLFGNDEPLVKGVSSTGGGGTDPKSMADLEKVNLARKVMGLEPQKSE